MNARLYDPVVARMLRWDTYAGDGSTQGFNRYSYAMNNPLKYTDPTGNFLTWSISTSGFSIGLNFTPVGVPLGFGINVGFNSGGSAGLYGEVGYRVGGTGFGAGVAVSQSINYSFGGNSWSTSTTVSAYASLGLLNGGASAGIDYDITSNNWTPNWGISAGIGLGGNANAGIGFSVSYGSSGWGAGIGGWYQKPKTPQVTAPRSDKGGVQSYSDPYELALDNSDDCGPCVLLLPVAIDYFLVGAGATATVILLDKVGETLYTWQKVLTKEQENHMKGGKQKDRDRDFGISDKEFWDWWHQEGKDPGSGRARDIKTREQANDIYNDWKNWFKFKKQ